MHESFFIPFQFSIGEHLLPHGFAMMVDEPHALCLLAAKELQNYLLHQEEWSHNFGLTENSEGTIIGKMFGVLVVKNKQGEVGYLAAFSGKLAGETIMPNLFRRSLMA